MKTRILNSLKSRVLLVDGIFPDDVSEIKLLEIDAFNAMWIIYLDEGSEFIGENESNLRKTSWKLLGKLKDLTDNDCEGLVESKEYTSYDADGLVYDTCYKNYQMNEEAFKLGYLVHTTPKDSFLSALEAEGLHLNGNPFGKNCPIVDEPEPSSQYYGCQMDNLKDWQEAEQNVFSPQTLIFIES